MTENKTTKTNTQNTNANTDDDTEAKWSTVTMVTCTGAAVLAGAGLGYLARGYLAPALGGTASAIVTPIAGAVLVGGSAGVALHLMRESMQEELRPAWENLSTEEKAKLLGLDGLEANKAAIGALSSAEANLRSAQIQMVARTEEMTRLEHQLRTRAEEMQRLSSTQKEFGRELQDALQTIDQAGARLGRVAENLKAATKPTKPTKKPTSTKPADKTVPAPAKLQLADAEIPAPAAAPESSKNGKGKAKLA